MTETYTEPELLAAQAWRTETPGAKGWGRTARPDDPNKYFVVSADCHAIEPKGWMADYLDQSVIDRIAAHARSRESAMDAERKAGVRQPKTLPKHLLDASRMVGEDRERFYSGRYADQRVQDNARDGVDVEIIFPGAGFLAARIAPHHPQLALEFVRGWNNWAHDWYADHRDRQLPMAFVPVADVEGAVAEIQRVAALGFRGICLPNKPVFGPQPEGERNYNDPEFDRLWSAVVDVGLPVTFHVSTGRSPTTTRGPGGAVSNYVAHCCATNIEPLVLLCASGICERFPELRFAVVESGIGWVPWTLTAMDEAYRKHHMWARPKLEELPSTYFRRQGYASFGEDAPGLALAEEFDLVDNFMWASDYPHPEGSWPHSVEAIERQMGRLTDEARAKILGLNAAKLFGLTVPSRARDARTS